MRRANLDLDTLRTLVVAHDLGNHGEASVRLGRTPSAVSLQLKRLSDDIGQPLFRKLGRHRVLTEAGEQVLAYGRRMLALNDELLDTLRGAQLGGRVALGVAQDFAALLPSVLSRYAALYPRVTIEVRVEGNSALADAMDNDELDIAVTVGRAHRRFARKIGELDLVWITSPNFKPPPDSPLPLAMLGPQCAFRKAAITHVTDANIPWRIAAVSPSLDGLWAAVRGGLGVTLRSRAHIPLGLDFGRQLHGLPQPGAFPVVVHIRPNSETATRLDDLIMDNLHSLPDMRKAR